MKAKLLQVPTGENLSHGDENFIKFEEAGVKEAQNAAFVLVAGGLGERLGYNGIKVLNDTATLFTLCCSELVKKSLNFLFPFQVALPFETITGTCFLQNYIESVLALQEASYRMTQGLSPKAYYLTMSFEYLLVKASYF